MHKPECVRFESSPGYLLWSPKKSYQPSRPTDLSVCGLAHLQAIVGIRKKMKTAPTPAEANSHNDKYTRALALYKQAAAKANTERKATRQALLAYLQSKEADENRLKPLLERSYKYKSTTFANLWSNFRKATDQYTSLPHG